MKTGLKNLVMWPLMALLVFVPVLCCCLSGAAFAQDQRAGVTAKSHSCCDESKPSNAPPRQEDKQCDCAQHLFSKAANRVFGETESIFPQHPTPLYQISGFGLVLSPENSGSTPVDQPVNSPPRQVANPLYIQFRNLRI